jgi:hypothetical protein
LESSSSPLHSAYCIYSHNSCHFCKKRYIKKKREIMSLSWGTENKWTLLFRVPYYVELIRKIAKYDVLTQYGSLHLQTLPCDSLMSIQMKICLDKISTNT